MDIRNFFNAKGQASNAALGRSAPGASKYGVESKFFGKNGSAEKRKEVAKATTGGLGNDESLEVSTMKSRVSTQGHPQSRSQQHWLRSGEMKAIVPIFNSWEFFQCDGSTITLSWGVINCTRLALSFLRSLRL
jgi:hypothetical protein